MHNIYLCPEVKGVRCLPNGPSICFKAASVVGRMLLSGVTAEKWPFHYCIDILNIPYLFFHGLALFFDSD